MLRDAIVLPGTVRAGKTIAVLATAPYQTVIVTKMLARRGSRVTPGHVLDEVDGRPVVLLRGKLPAYRDLRVGDTGPDVAELQSALTGLGYSDYDSSGVFGAGTEVAIELLYDHLGYRTPLFTPKAKKGELPPVPQVYLPMDEVSYIPAASALVTSISARTGTTLRQGQVVLGLAVGNPYVTGLLSAHQATQARDGVGVRIGSANPSLTTAGTVTRISAIPAKGTSTGPPGYAFTVTTRHRLPQGIIGRTVRLTLLVPVTSGPGLTAPLSAVFSGPATQPGQSGQSGQSSSSAYVIVVGATGRQRRVDVLTGPSAQGYVAIQPVKAGTLIPGDRVLIGVGR